MKSTSLRILAGLFVGVVAGALLAGSSGGLTALRIAQPVGKLWLDGLTMTVVPLVFSLLVSGVMSATAHASNGTIATRALLWFAVLLLAASLLSVAVTSLVLRASPLPQAAVALVASGGVGPAAPASADWLGGIVPTNVIRSAADTAMVPLVLFALLFGIAATRIESDLSQQIERTFRGIAQAMLMIVRWVLWLAPLGVLALGFGVGLRLGGGAAGVLAHYVMVVVAACLATTLLSYAAAMLFGRIGLSSFARAALPAQIIAVSTQSSLASLPAMVEASHPLGIAKSTGGIVIPLAVSLFRATSAGANVAVAIYLAHLHAVPLSVGTMIAGAIVAAAVSVAAVGLPAQVSFFAIIAPVCIAMGVPVVLLPLLLAIETLPDVFRTLGNVTADLAVARIVGRRLEPHAKRSQ
ncbi:dicarboxylate/amino acid:cation symporter [Sphingomonas sp.]|jgi:Na+/H+-dicarboxylate symporter|uniref:dicarboxylate/amino acid:cation symporter n=1 Tax=Sphingomonas sp. TaxID=28214 RepID=UPI002EDB8F4B